MLSLLSTSSAAQPSNPSCFSEREFSDVLLILAPAALKIMSEQCAPTLRSGQVLGNPQSLVAKNIDAASRAAWPRAFSSIIRVMKSQGELPKPEEASMTREAFNAGVAPILGKIITKADSCPVVDKVLKLSEPLPPENLAGMFVQILRIVPSGKELEVLCPLAPGAPNP